VKSQAKKGEKIEQLPVQEKKSDQNITVSYKKATLNRRLIQICTIKLENVL